MAGQKNDSDSLLTSIKDTHTAIGMCLCNKFNEAEQYIIKLGKKDMYHQLSLTTIAYLKAVLTYEQVYIDSALEKVKAALSACDSMRKKQSWNATFSNWIGRQSFNDFTIVELHAEVCYAECLLMRAMLTFIQDENLVSFIKGGLKIRNAYMTYRNCLAALEQNPACLMDSPTRKDFESGVQMGVGTFNLLLSLLPTRVLRLLEWIGFSGDKENGLHLLDAGCFSTGLRGPVCALTLLGYYVIVSPLLGIGDTDIAYSQRCLDTYLQKFPQSCLFIYFSGRIMQTQGLLDNALERYKVAVSESIDWKQVHHVCYWDMMWCYSYKGDWLKAAEYASILATESRWSKCSYKYMQASFLIMQQTEQRLKHKQHVQEYDQQIQQLLNEVVTHKQRIAGKSIPFEKFAVARVTKYQQTEELVIPALEMIHVWNGFTMFKKHTETLEHFLHLSQLALEELDANKTYDTCHLNDNRGVCKLLQGVCLRHLQRYDEAITIFQQLAASEYTEFSCKTDCYIPAFASGEMGFTMKDRGDNEQALDILTHTLKHYKNYGLESRLHFRLHSGIAALKKLTSSSQQEGEKNLQSNYFDAKINGVVKNDVKNNDGISCESGGSSPVQFYTPTHTPELGRLCDKLQNDRTACDKFPNDNFKESGSSADYQSGDDEFEMLSAAAASISPVNLQNEKVCNNGERVNFITNF